MPCARAIAATMGSPAGPVYQAGTLSGNPLAMAAGLATLRHLDAHRDLYDRLEILGARLQAGLEQEIQSQDYPATVNRVGSMITLFFSRDRVANWDDAARCNRDAFGRYHRAMLEQGFYLPPSQFEAAFLSIAHTEADIDRTTAAARLALQAAFAA